MYCDIVVLQYSSTDPSLKFIKGDGNRYMVLCQNSTLLNEIAGPTPLGIVIVHVRWRAVPNRRYYKMLLSSWTFNHPRTSISLYKFYTEDDVNNKILRPRLSPYTLPKGRHSRLQNRIVATWFLQIQKTTSRHGAPRNATIFSHRFWNSHSLGTFRVELYCDQSQLL